MARRASNTLASSRIAVLGLWHLGETYAAGLAHLGHRVVGLDEDENVISELRRGVPPLAEPGLVPLLKKHVPSGRLAFGVASPGNSVPVSDSAPDAASGLAALKNCDTVWITIDTPVDGHDQPDISPTLRIVRQAAPYFQDNVLLVVSSQIPVGTSEVIQKLVRDIRPRLSFHYSYMPENLRLGEALNCFLHPERVVVGASDDEGFSRVKEIFRKVRTVFVRMSPASAEMAKHATNAFLATSISFINDIADLSERTGADILDVAAALRADPRVGKQAALGAGLGFSGGTLGRDLVALTNLCRTRGVRLTIIDSVLQKNATRPARIINRLSVLLGGLHRRHIAIYGLTYKAGTTTLRRSRSLEFARGLARRGAALTLCDPHLPIESVPRVKNSRAISDPYCAARGAHALVFITPWHDFLRLDFKKLAKNTRTRAIVFDATNHFYQKENEIRRCGFRYHGVGR